MGNFKKVKVVFFIILFSSGTESKPYGIHPNVNNVPNSSQIWQSRSLKVVGGSESNSHEFPWMVALVYENLAGHSFVRCGGSLISHNVVLTAAHCIKTFETDDTELKRVKLGHANLMSEDLIEVGIESIQIHPAWNGRIGDIALIMLTEYLEFNSNVHAISLPRGK